jgi:hypothetical protein
MPTKSRTAPFHDPATDEERGIQALSDAERTYVMDALREFAKAYKLRNDSLPILGGRSVKQLWDDSERDYAVFTGETDEEDVKMYQSTVSRDKANLYISHIAGSLMYPDVLAQNADQSIDRTWSRVGSSLLEFAHKQDGWPNENGQQKAERIAHSTVVRGTGFALDIVTKDGLESEEIPTEEMFFTTFWQPNIQKHSVVFRAKLNITFEEAEQMFGSFEPFGRVTKGVSWLTEMSSMEPDLKTLDDGFIREDGVSVLYVWKLARPDELEALKKAGKVRKKATRAVYYNVIVNGVPMFPPENLSPYRHGYYPIAISRFEMFRSDFLYGNSAPNKMREDKRWRDDWKTLLRYKGKLGAIPPQLITGGSLDEQVVAAGKQTYLPEGVEVKRVDGVPEGVSQSDISLLSMADSEIDRASVSPSSMGQRPDTKQTARAEVIQAANAEKMLEPFTRQWAYFMQSRSFHVLLAMLQYLPKKSIKKVVVPDQKLSDGLRGTFEVLFEDTRGMKAMEKLERQMEVLRTGQESRAEGDPKDSVIVSPAMADDMKFYLFSGTSSIGKDQSIVRRQQFRDDFLGVISKMPEQFDITEAAREWVRMNEYDERILSKPVPPQQGQPGPGGAMPPPGGAMPPPGEGMPPPTEGDATTGEMAKAVIGKKMPNLPV